MNDGGNWPPARPARVRTFAPLGYREFRLLWVIGGLANAMRWLELLATGLFVQQTTGSAMTTALVTAARSLPLLLGPLAGAIADTVDRRHLLIAGLCLALANALAMAGLAAFDLVTPWHLGIGSFVAGLLWATDLSARRRMLAETIPPTMIPRGMALDGLTGSATRAIGPVAGGIAFATLGLAGAFLCSAGGIVLALGLVAVARHSQSPGTGTAPRALLRAIIEGIAMARADRTVRTVIAATVTMNAFAFSFSGLVAPIGAQVFQAQPIGIGLLAAAEPLGSLIGALALARAAPATGGVILFLGGSLLFLFALLLMPLMPTLPLAAALLVFGGTGTAAFATYQSTLVLGATAPEARSRVMGLVTLAIGTGPVGMILSGGLASAIGPAGAVMVMAGMGAAVVSGLLIARR